ncbi:serine/threonine protein kinase [Streptomyces sp. NBC_01239]|uniref:serine/threonine-protein kinase n=1 Tax=Streptomyces sp. NBC_01239 TaxID=2903792 RepID=UPI002257500A|nr:serine/threonine-protein kinase [Streptomyces sp. NBC_01239]MCX4813208.1 serine/threonine protein kinase [Streptomyces sp. NBC_01239]
MSEAERAGTSRQDTRRDKNERLLAGRYRLGEVLGRGGMGTVWRAEDETLGRTVAVKELRFPTSIDEDEKRRLITRTLREAKAIARIRNTSAVTVYDVVDEDDRPWIVMELVEGKSLAEAIREDGLLKPRRAAEVGLAILDVLRSAHREGILHRDVKPSNVLIAEDGRVVLTDFGIAQVEGDPSITSTGMLVGAPSYISPERARGHKPGPAADLWSLGGLLYAAVEGAPPYDKGSAIATLTAVMTEPLEEPKNAGPLKDVIYGLLNKDPAQRLDDAGARAMLTAVIHAPERKPAEPEPPLDATRVVPLPAQPGPAETGGKKSGGGSGSSGASAGAERLRGALRSMRKAAGGSAAAGAAAAGASAAAGSATGSGAGPATGAGSGATPSRGVSRGASGATTGGAARTGSGAATDGASAGASTPAPGKPGGSGPGAGSGAAAAGADASGKSGSSEAKGAAAKGSSGSTGAKSGTSGVPSARSGSSAGAATRSGTSAGAGTAAGAGAGAVAGSAAKGGATDSGSRDAGSRDSGVQSSGLREPGLGDTGTKGLSATREVGARGDKSGAGGRSSGWPVMTPPDLPPRPVPRAPLTDVVPKRTLVIIAVVVALAVIGVVLALTLGGGDDSGSKGSKGNNGAKAGGGVSASASASADEKKDDDDTKSSGGAQTDPSATASAGQNTASSGTGASSGSDDETTGGSSDGAAVVKTYKASQGFSIGLPAGWSYQSTDSAGVRLAGPDGQKLLIAWTSTPKSDAVADWKNQEQYMTRSGYSRIRIEKVDYRGWNTADWEFTYQDGGTKYRTIDRGFVVNSHLGYALMYTAKAANWGTELRKDTWTTLTKTFQPKS